MNGVKPRRLFATCSNVCYKPQCTVVVPKVGRGFIEIENNDYRGTMWTPRDLPPNDKPIFWTLVIVAAALFLVALTSSGVLVVDDSMDVLTFLKDFQTGVSAGVNIPH